MSNVSKKSNTTNTPAVTIREMPDFTKDADLLLSKEELDDLRTELAFAPLSGSVIPGTSGIRKIRFGVQKKNKGKRGGARVIYYYHDATIPLVLLALYAKGEKLDLTTSEKKELKQLVGEYLALYKKL
jgi:hypothetical protein